VEKRPYLRYIEVKRRRSGHGHVVVYSLTDDAVQVVHIFHTAQNWRVKL
jgi:plasmid stabilization system protein ParE